LVLNKEEIEQKDKNSLLKKKNHKKTKRLKEEEIVKLITNLINLFIILFIKFQMEDVKIIDKTTMKIIITKEEVVEEIEYFQNKVTTNIKVEANVDEVEVEDGVVTVTVTITLKEIIKIHKEATIIGNLTQTIIKLTDKEISRKNQLTNKNNRVKLDLEIIIMSI
jgi:hypothetical protein